MATEQKKVFVHSAFGRWPVLEYELDMVQRELDEGSEVYFAWCKGGSGYCAANNPKPGQEFRIERCISCKSRVKAGLRWLENSAGSLIDIEFRSVTADQRLRIDSLKKLIDLYGPVFAEIQPHLSPSEELCWLAALSGLNTDLKDSQPDLHEHQIRFSQMFSEALTSMSSMENHLTAIRPDLVLLYNGRMPRYWPALEVCRKFDIAHIVYEFPNEDLQSYIFSENLRPHETTDYGLRAKEKFNQLPAVEREKVRRRSEGWFALRSQRILSGRQAKNLGSSLGGIETGILPENWRTMEDRTKVAIFPSSQYEYANLPSHQDSLSLVQVDTIRSILSAFAETHFYVRIHPGQPESDVQFMSDVQSLSAFPNCTLVQKSHAVDSYALGMGCDSVITFGSTIGIELAYLGAPVIECGSARFATYGATTFAGSVAETILALQSELGSQSQANDRELRREAALLGISARFTSAREATYLEKDDYWNGKMVRNGARTVIKGSGPARMLESLERLTWSRSFAFFFDPGYKLIARVRDKFRRP